MLDRRKVASMSFTFRITNPMNHNHNQDARTFLRNLRYLGIYGSHLIGSLDYQNPIMLEMSYICSCHCYYKLKLSPFPFPLENLGVTLLGIKDKMFCFRWMV